MADVLLRPGQQFSLNPQHPMQALATLAGLGSLVCFIIVVIKLFKEKGVLHGILGIICGLYTFIWGWIESGRLNIKNVMLGWTACIVLQIIFGGMAAAALHH
jgi:hypothetical protein